MISYDTIRDVHLEISTLCNASCPWCPRNFWGYPYNSGYPELYLTLENAQKIFQPTFLSQLTSIRINGNLGDIVMNPDGLKIVEYFRAQNPQIQINVSTNGGGRNQDFWVGLANTKATITFALDGLEDTHHLYRQNTVWDTVIKNARTFINAGGRAIWQMIQFDHNVHQIDSCRLMSQQMGFFKFLLLDRGRNIAPVFNHKGILTHVLGDYRGETNFNILFHRKKTSEVLLEDITPGLIPKKHISCETRNRKSIYIAANGDVSPCCWTGFYPQTFGHGQYHQAVNAQLIPLIRKNSALEYPLEECIQWFQEIERSWEIPTYSDGRLVVCDDNCGS